MGSLKSTRNSRDIDKLVQPWYLCPKRLLLYIFLARTFIHLTLIVPEQSVRRCRVTFSAVDQDDLSLYLLHEQDLWMSLSVKVRVAGKVEKKQVGRDASRVEGT
ncbi:hypothetical protein K474DRAFT_608620 [Panus rudis PR-1116 ss-1]|nr:hypothetical protein K474DRAFT_608620 [Panus rudis PR-1116 ss-1]